VGTRGALFVFVQDPTLALHNELKEKFHFGLTLTSDASTEKWREFPESSAVRSGDLTEFIASAKMIIPL
jgi:hypothetical protein